MKIALDYDETYTAQPEFYRLCVFAAKHHGIDIRFVTARGNGAGWDNDDIEADAAALDIPIIYCAGKQKAHCWDADNWWDDSPIMIPSYNDLKNMLIGCAVNDDIQPVITGD